ncbi:MAG: hypothetical protein OXH00_02975 [Candidatus Poribacteria bacterium]|nr:hypothetical protein [Candidatus Poribacteria bacterium]
MDELIILEGIGRNGRDEFMVVSGERIETQADPNFYPFGHAVTFRLCQRDAGRIGQETITVAETAILTDCDLPSEAPELPAVETHTPKQLTKQLTLFGDTEAEQTTLF